MSHPNPQTDYNAHESSLIEEGATTLAANPELALLKQLIGVVDKIQDQTTQLIKISDELSKRVLALEHASLTGQQNVKGNLI